MNYTVLVYEFFVDLLNNVNYILNIFWLRLYDLWYVIFNITLNYCKPYYQLMFFYFPLVYYFRRKTAKKKNWENFFENSLLNYLLINIKILFIKLLDFNTTLYYLTVKVKELFYYSKVLYIEYYHDLTLFIYKIYKNNFAVIFWRPIFKKLSYYGFFSFIRTKWYKKK